MAGLDMVKRRDDKVDGRRGLERFAGALVSREKRALLGAWAMRAVAQGE